MFCAFGHNSRMATSRYRVPAMSEQHVLEHVRVRLIDPDDAIERDRYRALIEKHHYLNSQLFRGTCYKAQGWRLLGETKGHGRARQDYYTTHNRPKQLWVRELRPKACATLRAARLPADLQHVEDAVIPRADLTMVEIRRLLVLCRQVPDWRAKKGKDYSLQCLLSIMVMATLAGVARGQRDLAAFAQGLTRFQLRALGSSYWEIESGLHQRLDVTAAEDASRVRNRNGLLVLGILRRCAMGIYYDWRRGRKNKRQSTLKDFHDDMRRFNNRHAFATITSPRR